jgi:ElaB/YqjD/DUF883 family membrane-anchored ribosome-binding protein
VDNESPELIERRMNQTRQSLTDKVVALEQQVVGTIQSATSAVQETVESVKSAVSETVTTVEDSVSSVSEGVMHAFDVRHHVDQHPWLMVGGAAAAGFLTGLLVFREKAGTGLGLFASPAFGHASYTPTPAAAPPRAFAPERDEPRREEPKRPGWLDELFDRAGQEARKLGEAALASVVASLQRNIKDGLPQLIDNALHVPDRTAGDPAGRRANGPQTNYAGRPPTM